MFDEPTKGVDVGAKAEIYKVIGDLAAEGLGVIVVSRTCPRCSGSPTACSSCARAASRASCRRKAPPRRTSCGSPARRRERPTSSTARDQRMTIDSQRPTPPAPAGTRGDPAETGGAGPHLRRRLRTRRRRPDRAARPVRRPDAGLGRVPDRHNMANLARQVAIFGIIAVGQLLVILTAGIDLSVGSVLGLTGCVTAADAGRTGCRSCSRSSSASPSASCSGCSTARSSPTASCRRSS